VFFANAPPGQKFPWVRLDLSQSPPAPLKQYLQYNFSSPTLSAMTDRSLIEPPHRRGVEPAHE
jgi:hypothetical protein